MDSLEDVFNVSRRGCEDAIVVYDLYLYQPCDVNGNAHPTIFRSFHIRLDHRRSWRQNQNDSPYLFAIVHRPLTAIAGYPAANQQMDQNKDIKHPLQQLLLQTTAAC